MELQNESELGLHGETREKRLQKKEESSRARVEGRMNGRLHGFGFILLQSTGFDSVYQSVREALALSCPSLSLILQHFLVTSQYQDPCTLANKAVVPKLRQSERIYPHTHYLPTHSHMPHAQLHACRPQSTRIPGSRRDFSS
jgi:hypothetical protein